MTMISTPRASAPRRQAPYRNIQATTHADPDDAVSLAGIRRARALTQGEVAERLGVDQSTVSRIEHGSNAPLSVLLGYLAAVGVDSARVVAEFEGAPIEISLH